MAKEWGILLKETTVNTYQGERKDADGHNKLKIWIHRPSQTGDPEAAMSAEELEAAPSDLVILFEPESGSAYNSIVESLARVEETLEAYDTITGSFSVRGVPIQAGAATRIAQEVSARQQESYYDGHTKSVTYWSSKLNAQVESGNKKVNLQIAETAPSPETSGELIIGVPLITGDYTVTN